MHKDEIFQRLGSRPRPKAVLIAGPTASGKSDLAMDIAEKFDGVVVNADALQVYRDWRVLTARPAEDDEKRVPHALYGHVANTRAYSVGDWLRDFKKWNAQDVLPVIVGGTGLYFRALTEGLAEIPPTPAAIRQTADAILAANGLETLLADLDVRTKANIDIQNPKRVARAWEVWKTTERSIIDWHDATPAPQVPSQDALALHIAPEKDWLNERIARRFRLMVKSGALDEVRLNIGDWSDQTTASQAIGAPELKQYLDAEIDLKTAQELSIIATRQYAKRQRTWFRKRMRDWHEINPQQL